MLFAAASVVILLLWSSIYTKSLSRSSHKIIWCSMYPLSHVFHFLWPVGLKAQLDGALHWYHRFMGLYPFQAWILEASLSRMRYLSIQMWWLSNYKVCSSHNYMIFMHSPSYIHLSRVHYELTQWPVPSSWLNISVGKSAAPVSQGHGFETRSSVIFFSGFLFATVFVAYTAAMVLHVLNSCTSVLL